MPFASISAVLFTPALPEIARWLQISEGDAQAAMTVFLLGYAFGNLPYGPIAKRFGRKPAIYLGVILAIVGFLITLFGGIYRIYSLFLVGRLISALGSSVGMKISFTMIGDAFEQAEATQKVALANLAFAIAPGLSVAIGGVLTTYFGWQACFYALIAYSGLVFTLALFLPETASHLDPKALNFTKIIETYQRKFKNRKLVYSALSFGCVSSLLYLFSTLAPFLGISQIGLSPEAYGFWNFVPPMGLLFGSLASHWLSTRKSKLSAIRLGSAIATIVSLVILIFFATGHLNAWTLFLPAPFLYFGSSLVFSNASTLAMEHVQDKSNGSAVMSFLNMSLATLAVLFAQSLASPAPIVMPLLFLICCTFLFFFQYRLKKAL